MDTYELQKAQMPQSLSDETPYESKQYNFVNDINAGVYTNSQTTLVQFDLSSIYNSGKDIDLSQMYLTVPMIYTGCYTNGANPLVPSANAGNEFLITPKNGSWNLIQSMEVVVNGQTVIQQTPNVNFYTNFKILSQMSADDLKTLGRTLGFYPDDVLSYLYNGSASALSGTVGPVFGNGLCNNMIFPMSNQAVASDNPLTDLQNIAENYCTAGSVFNKALQYRSQRIANNQSTPANGMNQIISSANLNQEFSPYFAILNTYYMTWYDVALIRMCDICDFFAQAPLTKNFDALLRIYFNTGFANVGLSQATHGGMYFTASNGSFSNCCPFTINQLPVASLPAGCTNLVVSATIARSTVSQNIAGAQLSLSNASHPMNNVRMNFPQITMKPTVALKYHSENRAKRIVYTNVLSNFISNIPAGSTWSQLIQSGVRNIKGVLLIPYISQTVNGLLTAFNGQAGANPAIIPFPPCVSPFDTAPLSTPCSLTQLNISIGGVNQLMNFYNYTYENYVQQINGYENINSGDLGLASGLISQYDWEHGMRYYYIDCSRATMADMNTPRNINITFLNNNQVSIDMWCFVEHFDEKIMDCELGKLSA